LDSNLKSTYLPHRSQLLALAIPCLICCYLVLTSTAIIIPDIPVYDAKRIAQFILFFIVFLVTLSSASLRNAFAAQLTRIPKYVSAGIILFFALGIVSSVINSDSTRGLIYSLVDVSMLGLLFVMALIVASCRAVAGPLFDRVILALITLLGLAVGFQELMGYWAVRSAGGTYNFHLSLIHFSFPRMYNQLQTWTIPVLAALPFIFHRNRLAAALCIITLGLHWYTILVTGARGSIISLLVVFAFVSFISPLARKAITRWQIAGMVLGMLIFAVLLAVSATGNEQQITDTKSTASYEHYATENESVGAAIPDIDESNQFYDLSVGRPMLHTTGRNALWRTAIRYSEENPMLGIGPMNYACKGPVGSVGSPHNLAFQILSEWGIPATLILAALGFFLFWSLLIGLKYPGENKSPTSVLHVLLITSFLAALVHLMVSSLVLTPASQIAAALVGGWLLGMLPCTNAVLKPRSAVTLLCSSVLCSAVLLPFAYHETMKMPSYREQLPSVEQGRPRLWQLGKACRNNLQ